MIQGLQSAIYPVKDLQAAKAWYTQVLEAEPYFDQPFYVGFNRGGFELGLTPDGTPSVDGVSAYWGVRDIYFAFDRLIALGATSIQPVHGVGGDIKVATVRDPFGDALSIIRNPHFDLLAPKK